MSNYIDLSYCSNCIQQTNHAFLDDTPIHHSYTKVCLKCYEVTQLQRSTGVRVDEEKAIEEAHITFKAIQESEQLKPKFLGQPTDNVKKLALACSCCELDHGLTMAFRPEDEEDKNHIDLCVYIRAHSFGERLKWMYRILFKKHHLAWWGETIIEKKEAQEIKDFLEQVQW